MLLTRTSATSPSNRTSILYLLKAAVTVSHAAVLLLYMTIDYTKTSTTARPGKVLYPESWSRVPPLQVCIAYHQHQTFIRLLATNLHDGTHGGLPFQKSEVKSMEGTIQNQYSTHSTLNQHWINTPPRYGLQDSKTEREPPEWEDNSRYGMAIDGETLQHQKPLATVMTPPNSCLQIVHISRILHV